MDRTIKRFYRVERRAIALIRFILEGYDGLAVLTTLDRRRGTVVISIAPGCEQEADTLLAELAGEIRIQTLASSHESGGAALVESQ